MQQILVTMPHEAAPDKLSDSQYHQLAGDVLSRVEATVDGWLQDDTIDIDSQRNGGLLQLGFPNGSTIVINMQPPLQELWLAARAGGYHYRHVAGRWVDGRDGSEFFAVLSREASVQGGQVLTVEPA